MAIALSYSDYYTLFQEGVECPQGTYQAVDVIRTYPPQLGQGFMREMRLRAGLWLAIAALPEVQSTCLPGTLGQAEEYGAIVAEQIQPFIAGGHTSQGE